MGDPRGFLDVPRQGPTRHPVAERLEHYREIYQRLSREELQVQAARCMDCGVSFCHGAGCALGNLIPEWNALVHQGRWREASGRLHRTNNFPEITGRICPAPCEAACTVAQRDAADGVTIREIELAIVEHAWAEGWIVPQPPQVETGKRVAVIGSGPAGLAAAQQLRRAGHQVVVLEQAEAAGGLLRFGIPDFKLEKLALDRRIAQLEAEGVEFHYEVRAGADLSAGFLRKKYDALALCCGAGAPRDLDVPGREANGIHFAVDYLSQQNRRNAGVTIPDGEAILATGKRVIVLGGGDTSDDCLGTALRQGAASVLQFEIMPEPPPARDDDRTPWPLWPYMRRVSAAQEEGGTVRWNTSTTAFQVRDGHLCGLDCVSVEWSRDESGRMECTPVLGTEFTEEAELVLIAMGFVHPVHEGLLDDLGVAYDGRGNVATLEDSCRTSVKGLFAAGDAATGPGLVVGAIAAGRRLAHQVDLFLMGESSLPDPAPLPQLGVWT